MAGQLRCYEYVPVAPIILEISETVKGAYAKKTVSESVESEIATGILNENADTSARGIASLLQI